MILDKRLACFFVVGFLGLNSLVAGAAEDFSIIRKRPRLADRFYIQSVLTELFGPDSKEVVQKFVVQPDGIVGGPCDIYSQERTGDRPEEIHDPATICFSGKPSMSLPMVPHANLMREGFLMKACEALTSNQETLAYFSGLRLKVRGPASSDPLTSEQIALLFKAFNPEREPSSKVIGALQKVAEASDGQALRQVVMTLCIDPQWRVL